MNSMFIATNILFGEIISLILILLHSCQAKSRYSDHLSSASKNVLFIIADDMRPELKCYGSKIAITPNLDKLAGDGIIFTQAYSQQALCGPSRASFLTSRLPENTQVFDLKTYWRSSGGNFTTLPQYFKERGYFSYSIGKIFHPGRSSNHTDDYPLSWSSQTYHPSTEKYQHSKTCPDAIDGTLRMNAICPVDVSKQPEGTLPDIQITEHAIELLNNVSEHRKNCSSHNDSCSPHSKPFFLAVGFHKPHLPLKYPEKFRDLYPLDEIKLAPNRFFPPNLPTIAWNPWLYLQKRDDIKRLNISFPFGYLPDDTQKLLMQSYYASISYIDSLLGQLIEKLKDLNLYDDTIIIFTSDHGWQLGEHQEWEKFNNFRVTNHVPLIIKNAKVQSIDTNPSNISLFQNMLFNTSDDVLVELLDLFPTIVDLAFWNHSSIELLSKSSTSSSLIPSCKSPSTELLCTQGKSLAHRILGISKNPKDKIKFGNKHYVRWQYPRPSFFSRNDSDYPDHRLINFMGYSVMTPNFRYCEWKNYIPQTVGRVNLGRGAGHTRSREFYAYPDDVEENSNLINTLGPKYFTEDSGITNSVEKNVGENALGDSYRYNRVQIITDAVIFDEEFLYPNELESRKNGLNEPPLVYKIPENKLVEIKKERRRYMFGQAYNLTNYYSEAKRYTNMIKDKELAAQIMTGQKMVHKYFDMI